jgi:predicted transcriptional regulator
MYNFSHHPKAFLFGRKNVKKGLITRTKILSNLEQSPSTAKNISKKIGKSYSCVLHHLHFMEDEKIVIRKSGIPFVWKLTGFGQKRLM